MHGTLATQPLTAGPVRPFVDVFGDSDETEATPRVAVQVTINLTFAEILGRLLFAPSAALLGEDLDCPDTEERVRVHLWFALTDTGVAEADQFAKMAMEIYTGHRASNLRPLALRLGPIITHMFGVTAPQPPIAASAPALSPVRGVKTMAA
ncbi:hypothetical protein ACFYST_32785 [Kitasatospora sp. NPDC004614]|uniref:hypothetical protein n=1 Tax=unclassified Kitasatospora TaxID=2633591 RepID=UPI00368A164B